MTKCGIYSITNTVNRKSYIGSSSNIFSRWRHHKKMLEQNVHDNGHLQRAWKKYGELNFVLEVLEETPKHELTASEQHYLDVCKLLPFFYYNISYDATAPRRGMPPWNKGKTGVQKPWNKGIPFSDEAKIKMSIAGKQRIGPKNSMFDKKHSTETRTKLTIARNKRGPVSEETRLKMSIAQKKRFQK